MSQFYQQVDQSKPRRVRTGRLTLGILIAIALVILVLTAYPAVRMMIHQYHYKDYIESLQLASNRAYYKGGLEAEVEGATLTVSGENAYGIYTAISAKGSGYLPQDPPDREPDVRLSYGITNSMELWKIPFEDDANGYSSGILIRYYTGDTMDFSYIMVGLTMDNLLSRYLAPEINTPTE